MQRGGGERSEAGSVGERGGGRAKRPKRPKQQLSAAVRQPPDMAGARRAGE